MVILGSDSGHNSLGCSCDEFQIQIVYIISHNSLCKIIMKDTDKGGRKRRLQRQSWSDYIKEWTVITIPELLRDTANRLSSRRFICFFCSQINGDEGSSQGTDDENYFEYYLETPKYLVFKQANVDVFQIVFINKERKSKTEVTQVSATKINARQVRFILYNSDQDRFNVYLVSFKSGQVQYLSCVVQVMPGLIFTLCRSGQSWFSLYPLSFS